MIREGAPHPYPADLVIATKAGLTGGALDFGDAMATPNT